VQFGVNGNPVGAPVTVNGGGQATYSTSALGSGVDSITAAYIPGSSSFLPSSAPAFSQTVNGAAAIAPTIVDQPAPESVNVGANAAFWTVAAGTAPLSYQWSFNGTAIPGATSSLHVVQNAQASNAGAYSVTISNAAGTVTSNAPALTVNTSSSGNPSGFVTQPFSQLLSSGSTVIFKALLGKLGGAGSTVKDERAVMTQAAASVTYQWFLNGVAISGATDATYILSNATSADDGSYTCVATNSSGAVVSTAATLNVIGSTNPGRLINLSSRAQVGTGASQLIVGYVVRGQGASGSEPLLVRASGPALAQFGVTNLLADPELTLNGPSGVIAANGGWAGNALIASTAISVGAFGWNSTSSHDAALLESLPVGSYTAQITGASGGSGVALAEIYDASPAGSYSAASPRLINISARDQVGTGANILIAGFVIGGTTSTTVLIRGSGPALESFGVPGTLPDPQLQLFQSNSDGTSTLLESNTGWGGDATIAAIAVSVGAFSFGSSATADSAILITLPPGAYTAEVSGASGDTGVALVEIYEVP
jgi:hypothetical protein